MPRTSVKNKHRKLDAKTSALLLIDVITDFEFEDGDELLRRTIPAARNLALLKTKVMEARVPVIYVNDNFGKWQEDFKTMAEHFMRPEAKGRRVVSLLAPGRKDYYVLKPHRSAFYSTSLELLLRDLKAKTLIITGITTDICILFSANDAYMRGFDLHIPRDCVAAVKPAYSTEAMHFIERVLKADVRPSPQIEFKKR